jgi:cytochrome c biogenesis protein CcmG/thiol:disulfide interchange protein DsbE
MFRPLFAMISLAVLFAAGCTRASVSNDYAPSRRLFPEFRLDAIDGSEFDSKSLRGKVVLINFWASWCGPCRMETPSLVEINREYKDRGFEVVGIAVDPEDKGDIHKFVRDYKVDYPVLYSDETIEREVGLIGTPTSVLVDRDGAMIRKHVGPITKQMLETEIGALLNEKN